PNRADPDSAFTSPIKLFEYMAAGCALVVSDLPSVREVLERDDAVWTAPGDAAGLAGAVRALAEDPARAQRLGARVREKARPTLHLDRARRAAGPNRAAAARGPLKRS
ncbi:MAG TPA: glycosyltransferase, partial [Burkholderiales bacterium]|nr:glycosyltransferase [Burkholderiales bacterium]